jgi:hypothetical protein
VVPKKGRRPPTPDGGGQFDAVCLRKSADGGGPGILPDARGLRHETPVYPACSTGKPLGAATRRAAQCRRHTLGPDLLSDQCLQTGQ